MRIEANILCWNESETLHFTIKHYQKFCNKITIWDNYSDDGSDIIAANMGCDVQKFGIKGQLHDGEYTQLKNNCWKQSRADYVIICDADEILYEPPTKINGNIFKMEGFNMFSDEMPKEEWTEIKRGLPDGNYAKHIIFAPSIMSINFQPGAHVCNPKFPRYSDETLKVLHYKHIGGVQRVLRRNSIYRTRLSNYNKVHRFGIQYNFRDLDVIEYFNSSLNNSKDVI